MLIDQKRSPNTVNMPFRECALKAKNWSEDHFCFQGLEAMPYLFKIGFRPI
jgi:hypothetical protein